MTFSKWALAGACLWAAAAWGQAAPQPVGAPKPGVTAAASSKAQVSKPWKVLETFEVGPNVYVRALALDRAAGSMWVGTSSGVHEVDLQSLTPRKTFTRADGLANEYVFGIGIDHKGYKWFGTNAGGVSRYKDGEWKTFFPMHGLADYWIYTFASQKDGTLWIGTWAGANSVDPQSGAFTTYVKELVNEWVYGLGVDSKDRVWFGTEGGVSMFDGKRWRSWTHQDGLGAPNHKQLAHSDNTGLGTRSRHDLAVASEGAGTYNANYIFSIHVTPEDHVYAGTWGGGVSRWDGRRWTNITTEQGLAGDIVYAITQHPDGALWFGTNRGVSRWDGKEWMRFGRYDGLLDDHVYALAVAPSGEVWAGTKLGVARIGR